MRIRGLSMLVYTKYYLFTTPTQEATWTLWADYDFLQTWGLNTRFAPFPLCSADTKQS
jgi:hypothetical protein